VTVFEQHPAVRKSIQHVLEKRAVSAFAPAQFLFRALGPDVFCVGEHPTRTGLCQLPGHDRRQEGKAVLAQESLAPARIIQPPGPPCPDRKITTSGMLQFVCKTGNRALPTSEHSVL